MVSTTSESCCAAPALATALPEPDDAERARQRFQQAQDPYLDPFWAILKNNVGARTQRELDTAEHNLVHVSATVLAANPIPGGFDLDHLRAIHRHLFQDVYPFAGELRVIDMHKADDPGGGFFPHQRLRDGANNVFGPLAEERHLRGLNRQDFVARAGHYLDSVNHLHPFREGNGRTQRVFFSQLATQAGHHIDWTTITPEQNVTASRAGETALVDLLDKATSSSTTQAEQSTAGPDDEAVQALRAARKGFGTPASHAARARPSDPPRPYRAGQYEQRSRDNGYER